MTLDDENLAGDALRYATDGSPSLLGGRCGSCDAVMFPLKPACHNCGSEKISEEVMPGEGKLYSFTTLHVGARGSVLPRSLGYVDLTNGVRLFTHLTDASQKLIDSRFTLTTMPVGATPDGVAVTTFAFAPEA